MAKGDWSSSASEERSRSYRTKSADEVFTHTAKGTLSADLNPKGVAFRESRDSEKYPASVGIAVFLDVTGSMGRYPDKLVRDKLPILMETIIKKGTTDAHVLFGAIGDHEYDRYPFQVGQFECEAEPTHKWITSINIEHGGGSNAGESYLLAYYFALKHFSLDCIEKRGIKGFIFTIGDEPSLDSVPADAILKIFGDTVQGKVVDKELVAALSENYHIFHLNLDESRNNSRNDDYWRDLLGQNYIKVEHWETLPETIATLVAVENGRSLKDATADFTPDTAGDISKALAHYSPSNAVVKKNTAGVVKI